MRHLTAGELNLRHANIYDSHNLKTLNTKHDSFRSESAGLLCVWSGLICLLWFMLHKYSINNCVSIVFQGSNLLICIQYIINQAFLVPKNINDYWLHPSFYPLFIHDTIFSIGIKFLRQGIPFLKIMWQINPEFMMLWVSCLGHCEELFTALLQIDVWKKSSKWNQ